VTLDDVMGLARYETEREQIRRRIIALKRDRRVALGNEVSLVFENHDTVSFQVHEVYYTDAGGIERWTENPVAPSAESPAELREDIRWFLQAFRRPILEARLVV